MKKSLLFICLMAISLCSWAQENGHDNTTDRASLSSVELTPNGDMQMVSVSVENISKYSAYGLDIYLPDGYIFVQHENEDEEMVYVERGATLKTSHTINANIQTDGALRVTAFSSGSVNFKTGSNEICQFSIKATPYAKPGYADIQIKKCFFTSPEGIQYDTKDITISDKVSASNTSTVPVSVSAEAKWGTCILPFSCELPSGVKAYTCDSKDAENLLLTEVPQLTAYTPYILYSEAGYSGNLSGTVDGSQYPAEGFVKSGYLSGAIVPQTINSGYVLQNLSKGVMFYSCDGDEFNIPAGKCWVNIDGGSARERLGFKIENSLTGISNVAESSDANAIYTLSGLRVKDAAAPGIYVVNKKKVLKK